MKTKLKIQSVRVERVLDDSPDTSFLGRYSDSYSGAEPFTIIRVGEHAGEFVTDLPEDYQLPDRNREYRFYCPPAENYADCEEADIRKYCQQDYARMEGLSRGDWHFIGIIAKAEILNPKTHVLQTIRSGGLWGVESDAGEYLDQVAKEELGQLRTELDSLGLGPRAISHAFKSVETVCK